MSTPKLRTIEVQFPSGKKKYHFNITMRDNDLHVGDSIYLPEYNSNIMITRIFETTYPYIITDNCNGVAHFFTSNNCGTIPIKIVSWTPTYTDTPEKPCKKLSLEDAQEMYKQGGEIRKVALKYYSEEELNPIKPLTTLQNNKRFVLNKLQKLANTYNGCWTKRRGIAGYFINYYEGCWDILYHERVTYPGIVYFRNKETAYLALQQLSQTEREWLRS